MPREVMCLSDHGGGGHAEWELVLDDIYEAVLGHLSPTDVAALRCTCRCLRSKTDLLLRTLHLSRPHVKRAAARFQGLTRLHICLDPSMQLPQTLLQPLQNLRRLQHLMLENTGQAQPSLAGLEPLGQALHQLRCLHVRGCVVGMHSGLAACTSLRSLRLSNCILTMGVEEGFPAMLKPLARLEELACEGCSGLSPRPFAGVERLGSLRSCSLNRSLRVGDDTCRSLIALQQVRSLGLACSALEGCLEHPGISDAGVFALCALRQLSSLDLSGHCGITDAGVAAIAASLPILAHLDLRRPGPAVDGDPVHAAFGGLTDVGVCALRALPRLRSLRISEAQIESAGCAALGALAGSLRALELSHCRRLSDTAAVHLSALTALSRLSLAGCSAVTDIAVTALVAAMPNLAHLDLGGCHLHVGSMSLFAVATLHKLQVLRLSSCERVSDAGIRALCLGPAALCLEDLNLSDCDRLTDKAPAVIGAHLQGLRLLSLEHCHRVGDRGVAALEQLPNLEVLRLGGTGASASVAVSKFGQRVTLSAVPKHRIWWMLDAS